MQTIWKGFVTRLRVEARDLFEFVLLPGLAAVLPWRWCFALFKRLAYWPGLYRGQAEAALHNARQWGVVTRKEQDWMAQCRLTMLLDHADHYLINSRSNVPWMRKYLHVQGEWMGGEQAGMLWTFHWGMGMWALRHAREQGMRVQIVLAAPVGPDFAGRHIFGRYIQARMRSVERALESKIIFVPGGMSGIRQALADNRQLAVVMDVPADQVRHTQLTELLGKSVSVPAVLPCMASQQQIPVTVYYMGIDMETGQRRLTIAPLGVQTDALALTDLAFSHLDQLLRTESASWHFWAIAPRFFVARD